MNKTRRHHKRRKCFHCRSWYVLRLRINWSPVREHVRQVQLDMERVYLPRRAQQRHLDAMAGNTRKWRKR